MPELALQLEVALPALSGERAVRERGLTAQPGSVSAGIFADQGERDAVDLFTVSTAASVRSGLMPDFWLELDSRLRERLRSVLEDRERRVTEAELRRLAEEGHAFARILRAELERLERQLAERDSDPDSSLGAIANAFRRVHDFRAHIDELDTLLAALDERAREVRASWVLHSNTARGS